MEGVRFVVDEAGRPTAVQIDLGIYGGLWEDIHDALLAKSRKDEPRESLQSVKARLRRAGKLPRRA